MVKRFRQLRWWHFALLAFIVVLLLWIGVVGWFGFRARQAWKDRDTGALAQNVQYLGHTLQPILIPLSWQSQNAASFNLGLSLLVQTLEIKPAVMGYLELAYTQTDPVAFQTNRTQLMNELPQFISNLKALQDKKASWLTRVKPVAQHKEVMQWVMNPATPQLIQIFSDMLSGKHRWLVLLQNTDELRATGGFIGSFLDVSVEDGALSATVRDVYEVDGQFEGTTPAPPGVAEYLSEGKGLRLPNANWWPDFPTSATKILDFFALGNQQNIDGVIALNLTLVEDILRITGPVYLPDYEVIVTADTIHQVARADRSLFFPGSHQKPHFLQQLFNVLSFTISSGNAEMQQKIVTRVLAGLQQKDVQIFSPKPELQKVWKQLGVANELEVPPNADWAFLSLESNVGINKVNRYVTRTLDLVATDTTLQATVTIQNRYQDPEIGYIDYHRFYVPGNATLSSLTVDGKTTDWTRESVTTPTGQVWSEFGFLVPVLAQQQKQIIATFQLPQPMPKTLFVIKQPGVSAFPATITSPTHKDARLLETDTMLKL